MTGFWCGFIFIEVNIGLKHHQLIANQLKEVQHEMNIHDNEIINYQVNL